MRKPVKSIIAEIKRNKRFMGTCPACAQEFRLADAELFSLDEDRPEAALAAIAEMRNRIRAQRQELAKRRERMTKRAETTAHAVNLGKIVEKIVPSFPTFAYAIGDCRALFEPIDYIVFSGLAKNGQVDILRFIDVKSGSAQLTKTQKAIKGLVESGAVKFDLTRV